MKLSTTTASFSLFLLILIGLVVVSQSEGGQRKKCHNHHRRQHHNNHNDADKIMSFDEFKIKFTKIYSDESEHDKRLLLNMFNNGSNPVGGNRTRLSRINIRSLTPSLPLSCMRASFY